MFLVIENTTMLKKHKNRIDNYPLHDSMRGYFGFELYKQMAVNKDIWIITADLGYGLFDPHRDDFPDRFLNTGAAEQGAMGIAVGLAMSGKIPFIYSITPFLLYRPFETIRNYINHERIPVKLIGGGRDDDYKHDGFSHSAGDDVKLLDIFNEITFMWPDDKEDVIRLLPYVIMDRKPYYLNLRR